jgi:hypothetical protein
MSTLQNRSQVKTWMITLIATLSSLSYSAAVQAQAVFRTQQVISLDVIQGRPQSRQNAIQRLAGAAWQFNPDGTFVFAPANSRTDIYPLRGTFQIQGNLTNFQGSRRANNGVSTNLGQVNGSIDVSSGQPVMTIDWSTSSLMGAVVNQTGFGSSQTSSYRSQLILQQVR